MRGLTRALVATHRAAARTPAPPRPGAHHHPRPRATQSDVITDDDDAPPFATLVQGASRGIGLELARQMLERDAELFRGRARGGIVVATCRDPEGSDGLRALRERHGARLVTARVDVEDESTIEAAVETVVREVGRLDFMANVSAVLSDGKMRPETSIARTEAAHLHRAYAVNAVGPTMMMKHFSPLMLKTAEVNAREGGSGHVPVIANWSARVSSVGDNKLGGWHSYRASKTALNQLTRNAAIEFARKKHPIIAMCVHPGTVDTKLSEPFKKNVPADKLFTPEYAVTRLLEVIGDADLETSSGNLFDYAGDQIQW
jgi:NAD(P)-dependent dehydrogenase (short-subunit alcohol dehydrogenase family)